MAMQTLQHIPVWVFVLLAGLIALGLLQTRTRHIRQKRLLGLQIGLTIATLVGVALQWQAPVGPISISYALPLNDGEFDRVERLQFTFGQQF